MIGGGGGGIFATIEVIIEAGFRDLKIDQWRRGSGGVGLLSVSVWQRQRQPNKFTGVIVICDFDSHHSTSEKVQHVG